MDLWLTKIELKGKNEGLLRCYGDPAIHASCQARGMHEGINLTLIG